jgi:hypothetical protein
MQCYRHALETAKEKRRRRADPIRALYRTDDILAVNDLPAGPKWEYEVKFGRLPRRRIQDARRVQLLLRNGKDFGRPFRANFTAPSAHNLSAVNVASPSV